MKVLLFILAAISGLFLVGASAQHYSLLNEYRQTNLQVKNQTTGHIIAFQIHNTIVFLTAKESAQIDRLHVVQNIGFPITTILVLLFTRVQGRSKEWK